MLLKVWPMKLVLTCMSPDPMALRQLVVFVTLRWDASPLQSDLPRIEFAITKSHTVRLNHLGAGNWRAQILSRVQCRHCAFHNQTEKNRLRYQHNSHYSTLAWWPNGQWTRLRDRDTVLCSWGRHYSHIASLHPHVYRWVLANLMLGVTLQRTSIPSRGSRKLQCNTCTPSCFMFLKTDIRAVLISHLACMHESCSFNNI